MSLSFTALARSLACLLLASAALAADRQLEVNITPAAPGQQLVRYALPLPRGFLAEDQALLATEGHVRFHPAVRVLTWHPGERQGRRSARRAMVTFVHRFPGTAPVRFAFRAVGAAPAVPAQFPVQVGLDAESLTLTYPGGRMMTARLVAPGRSSAEAPRVELVESNACFVWQRFHLPDPEWPRVIEVRTDVLGGAAVVAHLQRNLKGDGWAPDFGWQISGVVDPGRWECGESDARPGAATVRRALTNGMTSVLWLEENGLRLYHPAAGMKRRGVVEAAWSADQGLSYRYLRCLGSEKVPMQSAAWQRAEFAIAPVGVAPVTAALRSPHHVRVDWRLWDELYQTGPPLELSAWPRLAAALAYHRDAIVRSVAHGDDWGNLTSFADGSRKGGVFGMNRLNHCPPVFEEAWRGGDDRLVEAAVLWCDNFHDQSIWWGPGQTGGTRYNNIRAQNRIPPENDQTYMWRSNDAVNFCTKGYDSFFLAYEETGDPRMFEALTAQLRYAAEQLHVDRGECRNIGDVRDFVRLYTYTRQASHLEEAQRLFLELRRKLSTGDLFSQGGEPLVPDPPFIDDDARGYGHPFAKPYIIGYALAGLPELARHSPAEPKLRAVVSAVADFLASSQDPVGGWRYPHPRSSQVIVSQGMEHAWQLVQADRWLGPRRAHLDAIERVLRQRILAWERTGKVFAGLSAWELAAGKVKDRSGLYALYQRPSDRDFERDYLEGAPSFGSSAPEGLVYFADVLGYYLRHRPAARLLTLPGPHEPLGRVLRRVAPSKAN
jgi:hypothetical protein